MPSPVKDGETGDNPQRRFDALNQFPGYRVVYWIIPGTAGKCIPTFDCIIGLR